MGQGGHGMMMAFHFGYCETVMFDWWKVSSVRGLLGSMVVVFIIAVLYETLKYYRMNMTFNGHISKQCSGDTEVITQTTCSRGCCRGSNNGPGPKPATMFSCVHGIQTFLQIIQLLLSYFLMLIFMTYNVWLCLALVIGAALGYFLFGWKTNCVVDACENCN
jgi:copper transporter 1